MTEDIWRLPATALAARYRDGSLTPSAALRAVLSRIAAANPKLNAFATLDEAGATAAAKAADARFAAGKPLGPMPGVPVSIKDNIPVAGLRCAWGSALWMGKVPSKIALSRRCSVNSAGLENVLRASIIPPWVSW
mgnify:CR=1 FL=1